MSLAQTYRDDKQYDKAIDNYQSEIRLRGVDERDQVGHFTRQAQDLADTYLYVPCSDLLR